MKEKLIKLLNDSEVAYEKYLREIHEKLIKEHITTQGLKRYEFYADYLLANGVIVPPCKVGDKVYIVAEVTNKIIECTVIGVWICEGNCSIITDHGTIYSLSLGETVFLTKEEAEQALKGGEG